MWVSEYIACMVFQTMENRGWLTHEKNKVQGQTSLKNETIFRVPQNLKLCFIILHEAETQNSLIITQDIKLHVAHQNTKTSLVSPCRQ